jgi:hypothetical protein
LLGVNTLKVRRRESVGLAIPASAVAAAVERAAALPHDDSELTPAVAQAACNDLVAALGRKNAGVGVVERAIGARLVATDGFASLGFLSRDDVRWLDAFVEDPTAVLLRAVALRLFQSATIPEKAQGDSDGQPCTHVAGSDDARTARFDVALGSVKRSWMFGWEQHRWKLTSAPLAAGPSVASFFEGVSPSKTQRKWKPSLR